MSTQTYGYVVPTENQTSDELVELIKQYTQTENDLPPLSDIVTESPEFSDGRLVDRPVGRRLLRRARRGDHVIVANLEQLGCTGRQQIRQLDVIAEMGLHLHLVEFQDDSVHFSPKQGLAVVEFLKLGAEMEQAARTRRTREAMRKKMEAGLPVNQRAPYGMRKVGTGKDARFVDCPWEKKWIDQIVEWREAGLSFPQIHGELRRRRAKTNTGAKWSYPRVKRVLAVEMRRRAMGLAGDSPSI